MADNNDGDNIGAAGGGEGVPQPPENDPYTTYVDTNIEKVTPNKPKEKKFSVKFDNFKEFPSEKGHMVESSKFSCFGHEWRLAVYPGGHESSLDGMVSVFLHRISKGKGLEIHYSLEIGKQDIHMMIRQITSDCEFYEDGFWGCWNFIPRDGTIRRIY